MPARHSHASMLPVQCGRVTTSTLKSRVRYQGLERLMSQQGNYEETMLPGFRDLRTSHQESAHLHLRPAPMFHNIGHGGQNAVGHAVVHFQGASPPETMALQNAAAPQEGLRMGGHEGLAHQDPSKDQEPKPTGTDVNCLDALGQLPDKEPCPPSSPTEDKKQCLMKHVEKQGLMNMNRQKNLGSLPLHRLLYFACRILDAGSRLMQL